MEDYERLERLYDEYDASHDRKERKRILEEILSVDPNDVDAMHRLVDLLPKGKQEEALLELKDKAIAIAKKEVGEGYDIYYEHGVGRPTMYVLEDLLERYEKTGRIEEAYATIKEMMALNEGDNLGERFHLIAYCIGQDKKEELAAFLKDCPDQWSPAIRFASLYLEHGEKNDDFKELFDELPYLYAFLSKEIPWKKAELDKEVSGIEMYRPKGFFECLIFYRLLSIYSTDEIKKRLFHLCAIYKDMPRISLETLFSFHVKQALYSMFLVYNNTTENLKRRAMENGVSEQQFEEALKIMDKYNLIYVRKEKEAEKCYLDEASIKIARWFVEKDDWDLMRIKGALGFPLE